VNLAINYRFNPWRKQMRFNSSIGIAAIPIIAFSLLVQGCNERKPSVITDKDTQVAAKVNGNEITVQQINAAVQRLGKLPEDKVKEISNQALNALVDQQLLVQKAIAEKLDQNPSVMQAIEAARRQILAQSYVQSKTENMAKPTDAEISEFYNKHPELFSDRRIYRLQEINIQNPGDKADAIGNQLKASKNLDEFAKWLKAQNFKFSGVQAERSAEQLPSALATQLVNVKPGQAIIANRNGILVVMVVEAVASQPVSADNAKAAIERILIAQKQKAFTENEIKSLRSTAKIEYMGDYANVGKEVPKPAEQTSSPKPEEAPLPATTTESPVPASPDKKASGGQ
jgi:EpsD family peptidyl-prolyl cis-trans isomerase